MTHRDIDTDTVVAVNSSAAEGVLLGRAAPIRRIAVGRFRMTMMTQMKLSQRIGSKLSMVEELWAFMRIRKKWWLGPILGLLFLMGLLIVFTEGSALAPFIYTLF